ncbi:MAG: hypothetical protein HQK98_09645 [Nitrospirae bacterium]|nr:hypothetical protein [Nitrospirota bacterium]
MKELLKKHENISNKGYFLDVVGLICLFTILHLSTCIVTMYSGYFKSHEHPFLLREFILSYVFFFLLFGIFLIITIYLTRFKFTTKISYLLNKYAVVFLFTYLILLSTWVYFDVTLNPFRFFITSGDVPLWSQVFHNLINYHVPDQSIQYINERLSHNPYFHLSFLSVRQNWLPLLLLPPVWALNPVPPMIIFSSVVYVFFAGSFGIYLTIRSIGGSKTLSLMAGMGYVILPQLEFSVFRFGDLENLGFALLPYLFWTILTKRWKLLYFIAFLFSITGLVYSAVTALIGILITIFTKKKVGLVVLAVGLVVFVFDLRVYERSIHGLVSDTIADLPLSYLLKSAILKISLSYIFANIYVYIWHRCRYCRYLVSG